MEWEWVSLDVVLAIHEEQIAEHGGLAGVPNVGYVEAALGRPQFLFQFGSPGIAELSAAYLFGLAKAHGFADGNKRTAWVVANTFLAINGAELLVDDKEAVSTVEAVAGNRMSEDLLAGWITDHLVIKP